MWAQDNLHAESQALGWFGALWLAIAVLCWGEGGGFMSLPLACFAAVYFLLRLLGQWWRTAPWQPTAWRVGLIALLTFAVITHHRQVDQQRRLHAEQLIRQVQPIVRQRLCPALNPEVLARLKKQHRLFLSGQQGQRPFLFYPSSWMPFSTYVFDFEKNLWTFASD